MYWADIAEDCEKRARASSRDLVARTGTDDPDTVLRCDIGVAMTDGVMRGASMTILQADFDALPETLNPADRQEARANLRSLPSLNDWILEQHPELNEPLGPVRPKPGDGLGRSR